MYIITKPKDFELKHSKSDVFLVSYPRSGNTWIRLVLANYIWGNPKIDNLRDLQIYLPDTHYKNEKIKSKKVMGLFRIIKSHEPYRADYKDIIYIFRRPFDCAWSYYNFLNDLKGNFETFDEFQSSFFSGNLAYGRWDHHINNWYLLHRGRRLFVCYEDLIKNPIKNITKMIEFLGLGFDNSRIKIALRNSTPDIVSKITNDVIFYGKEFDNFVRSPLGIEKQEKEKVRLGTEPNFSRLNDIYDEFREKIK